MAPTPRPRPRSSPGADPEVVRLRARMDKLRAGRRFRVEQLAALDDELAAEPRDDSVKRALHMAAATALAEIDAALDRVARGVYGKCVTCAQPIPEDRLDVLPMAAQCMPCQFNEQNCRLGRT